MAVIRLLRGSSVGISAALILALAASAQQVSLLPENGGSGSDGAFVAVGTTVFNSAVKALWEFSSFSVPNGATVRCIGAAPIVFKVQGTATISGTVDASGAPGSPGGTITLCATAVTILPGGRILANGGPPAAGGAAGPGGCIEIIAQFLSVGSSPTMSGLVCALEGATPPSVSGAGRIVFATGTTYANGTVTPAAAAIPWAAVATPQSPVARLTVAYNGSTTPYSVFAALNLTATPIPVGTGWFELDPADFLLNLLTPVNQLPAVFLGIAGGGNGTVLVDISHAGLPPGSQGLIWLQAIAWHPAGPRVTGRVPLWLRT